MVEPTNTPPSATAGVEEMALPDPAMAPDGSIDAVHSGVQVLGTPVQLVAPAASKASRRPSSEVT